MEFLGVVGILGGLGGLGVLGGWEVMIMRIATALSEVVSRIS